MTPSYLSSLVPPVVGQRSRYSLRNSTDVETLPARTQLYYNSFLPSAVREWNALPSTVRSAQSLRVFKKQLQNDAVAIPMHYYTGERKAQILHCRLRLNCSALNHHLFSKNIVESPHCSCGAIENTHHFFFSCPLYDEMRNILFRSLPFNIQPTTKLLLTGNADLSFEKNCELFSAVQKFIMDSKRFVI